MSWCCGRHCPAKCGASRGRSLPAIIGRRGACDVTWRKCFTPCLIDRENIKVHQSPVDQMIKAIGDTYSLIVFPEGHRNTGTEMDDFKSGLYYLAKKRPDLELVPVHIDNLNRVLAARRVPAGAAVELHHVWSADLAGGRRAEGRFPAPGPRGRPAAEGRMTFLLDAKTAGLLGAVLGVLCIATLIGQILKRRTDTNLNPEVVRHFHLRIRAWWFMCAILAATFLIGRTEATVVLFGLLSFWALREFITLTPTRPGDHRPLFWVFFIFTPLQYVLVGMELYDAVQHPDPGLCLPVHPCSHGVGRRLQAVFGADGEDSVRVDDLRLLLELRAGAVEPGPAARRDSSRRGSIRTHGCCSTLC